MSSINIRRAVENIRSGTTVYTPIVELIVNGIESIREARRAGGSITVTILRDGQGDMEDKLATVDGFIVRDDGVGFNQKHRDSFDTLYSETKAAHGGKGFGRFTCLKYFHWLKVESVFQDGPVRRKRSFTMGTANDIIVNETVADAGDTETGSVVTISGIRGVRFPDKGLDVIARVIVEKLLPCFIDPKSECPRIVVEDGPHAAPVILNEYLTKENRQIVELSVPNRELHIKSHDEVEAFTVRVFKFYVPRMNRSKISLVAHRREVTDVTLQTYIPEFSDEFYEKADESGKDRNYIIKAYVFGGYLDNNVSFERGAFNFQKDRDLVHGISQSQIEEAAAAVAQEAVGQEITARRERKQARIIDYVDTEAPWPSALTGTDPPSLMKADPADARLLENERGGARRSNRSRRSSALASFFVRREGRFFAPAYVSDRDARSVGQARSGATRSHAQRPIASMARIASTGP